MYFFLYTLWGVTSSILTHLKFISKLGIYSRNNLRYCVIAVGMLQKVGVKCVDLLLGQPVYPEILLVNT